MVTNGVCPGALTGGTPGKRLRSVLGYCNSPQMTTPEAYIQLTPGVVTDDGEVTDVSTARFLQKFGAEFRTFIVRVLTNARSRSVR